MSSANIHGEGGTIARAASRSPSGAPARRDPLSRDRVLRTAITLADGGGIGALTMRRLAGALGVKAMSLYYHVAGKDDLLSGIVDLVVSEIALPAGGTGWKADVRRSAIAFHAALARHPWAAGLLNSTKTVGPARLRYMDAMLRRLREAGLSPELTHRAYHALDSHIMGSTLWAAGFAAVKDDLADLGRALLRELPVGEYPDFVEHVRQHLAGSVREKGTFEFGLDLILDGLERIRDGASRQPAHSRRRGGRRG